MSRARVFAFLVRRSAVTRLVRRRLASGKRRARRARELAHQQSTLGKAQQRRAQQALAEVDAVAQWKPAAMSKIAVGAIVEIEDADSGEGRTLFLAPVGAGMTLTGPGGDGILSVVTPASPIGGAVMGRKVGDVVEIADREWQISYVS